MSSVTFLTVSFNTISIDTIPDERRWKRAAELPEITLYTSRHTAATLLQELGVSEEVRMKIMGQSSAAAHQAYVHIDQAQTRAALGKLERLLLD